MLVNSVTNKVITLKTSASVEASEKFSARINSTGGQIMVDSDLTGLRK